MNRKQFILGALSAAMTGMVVTKEDVATAEEVRSNKSNYFMTHFEDNGHYEYVVENSEIVAAYFLPCRGSTSCKMSILEYGNGATRFVLETREFASGSLLHRAPITIERRSSKYTTKIQDVFEAYVMDMTEQK